MKSWSMDASSARHIVEYTENGVQHIKTTKRIDERETVRIQEIKDGEQIRDEIIANGNFTPDELAKFHQEWEENFKPGIDRKQLMGGELENPDKIDPWTMAMRLEQMD